MQFGHDVGPGSQKIAVGDTLGCRNAAFAFTFHVDGCTSSTFADITLKGGPGFGFFHGSPPSQTGARNPAAQGGNTFSGAVLTYPAMPMGATELPVLSASADAFHVAGLPTGPAIVDSLLEGHNDDGIAIHGAYSVVVDVRGNAIWVSSADYTIGDKLRLYDTSFVPAGVVEVVGVAAAQPVGRYAPPHNASKSMPGKKLVRAAWRPLLPARSLARSLAPGVRAASGAHQLLRHARAHARTHLPHRRPATAQRDSLFAVVCRRTSVCVVVVGVVGAGVGGACFCQILCLSAADCCCSALPPFSCAARARAFVAQAPEPTQWYQVLQLKGGLPRGLGFDWVVFSAGHSSSGFVLRNNVIRNHRARGMLIKASDGLITGNSIANSTLGGIVVTPELSWGEGDYVQNLTVFNNSVDRVCTGLQCFGGLALGAVNASRKFATGAPWGHSNVTLRANTLSNIAQMNLWVSSAQHVRVQGNLVVAPYAQPPVATCCPPYPFPQPSPHRAFVAWATECSGLFVGGNCVRGTATGATAPRQGPALVLFNTTGSVVDASVVGGGFSVC